MLDFSFVSKHFRHFHHTSITIKRDDVMQKCDASGKHLWLRNGVFYFISEMPRVNGKRRYKRLSLHTDNYYEAREQVKRLLNTNQPPNIANKPIARQIKSLKISEVLDSWLHKSQNIESTRIRKHNGIVRMLSDVGLSLDNDYSDLHNIKIIESISRKLIARTDIYGDIKIRYQRYMKNLIECGHNIDPDNYKLNVIKNLPKIAPTKKANLKPHLPYTSAQLLEIFDPKHDFFHNNPDMLFTCLIGLFTGARINAAATLQYDDIKVSEGINCIEFIDNHPIKSLKTDASERIVPIHRQLLDIGFIEYIRRKQDRLKASGTDFIFPRCITTGNVYYQKYPRIFFDFLRSINIKTKDGGKLDFHSFRKNASLAMQDARIPTSYINDIIGWEGKSTMEQSYSNHTLGQIKTEVDKFGYDSLQPHFNEWKRIVAEM